MSDHLEENPSLKKPSALGVWASNTFEALHDRNFRLFFSGLLLSFTGAWARRTAVGWVIFEWTQSYDQLGYIFATMLAPLFVLSPFAGSAADKYDKKWVIIAARGTSSVMSFILAGMMLMGIQSVPLLFAYAFLVGMSFAFEVPARQAFVVEIVGRDRLTNAIALNSAMINLTRFLGPSVAGLLMYWTSPAFVFLFDGLTFFAVLFTLLAMRLRARPVPGARRGSRLSELAMGFKEAFRNDRVRAMLTLQIFVVMFGWTYDTLLPGIAQDILALTETQFGVLTGIFGFGAIIGALYVAGRGKKSRPRAQAYMGILLFFFGLFMMTQLRFFYGMLPCLLVAGMGAITFLSTANSVVQMNVDDEIRGRVMSVWVLIFGGCMPIGSLLAGQLATIVSPFTAIQIMVGCGSLGALTLFIKNKAWLAFFETTESMGVADSSREKGAVRQDSSRVPSP